MARILIVDQDKNLCLLYQTELATEGHEVIVAHDPESVHQVARAVKPDLVLTEIDYHAQPDGFESISRISRENRAVPVVINTGYAVLPGDLAPLGVYAWLLKSSNLRPLKAVIRQALQVNHCDSSQAGKDRRSRNGMKVFGRMGNAFGR